MQVGMSIVVVYLQNFVLWRNNVEAWDGWGSQVVMLALNFQKPCVIHGVPSNPTAMGDKFQIILAGSIYLANPKAWGYHFTQMSKHIMK